MNPPLLFLSSFLSLNFMTKKMKPILFLSSSFFLGLISVSVLVAGHTDMKCEVSSCGDITNISYPFWLSGRQPSYCGFPAFELRCKNDTPLIEMPSGDYQVKNIFYEYHSLVVAKDELVTSECPLFFSNVSFDGTPFAVSASANRELYLFYNCSPQLVVGADYFQVGCATISIHKVFAYLGGEYGGSLNQQQETCSGPAYIPVLGSPSGDSSQYMTLIKKGFLLEWTVADCEQCTSSKGRCGYSYETNNFICICSDRPHSKSCKKKNVKKTIAIASAVGGVVALIAACCVFFFWYKPRKRLQQSVLSNLLTQSTSSNFSSMNDPRLAESNYQTHIFSYEELQEATNGFDASRELGDGGFGTVYKGKLRDGRTVAVKRLYENNYKRVEQFMNEVDILSRLRHQNLVTLYGCTSRRSRELLLVYELVANGTVADHLHGAHASSGPLLWQDRMSIAIETADALAYLHAIEPPIIHRDVKSNNILLDNNFHVKVADFGLSRLFPLDATHVSTAPQGTPGYVDPEYHQCYQLTDKSDVYSFGVVLVELISSKPAVDISRSRHEINLANMAVDRIQKCQLEQLVDPALGYHSDLGVRRMITQVAELAFTCLQSDGDLRPSIKEVLEELKRIHSQVQVQVQTDDQPPLKEEEASLFSPDSVAERWHSRSTTPTNSQ